MEFPMRLTLSAAALVASLVLPSCSAQSDSSLPKLPHVDVTNVDASVSPCSDFYQYVCGKMIAANPIPADEIWWGPAEELQMWNRRVLRQILEKNEAPSPSRSTNEQKIGDFYASCMNQPEGGELNAIEPLLDRINAMRDKREIAATLAVIHTTAGRAWEASDDQTNVALLGYGPVPDYNDVSRVVAGVDQGGLGMPARDFYLKTDADSKNIRDQYVAFIVALLKLGGESEADASKHAATILLVETAMAQAQMDNVTRRDPNKTNNRYTLEQLKALTPAFNWDAYLRGLNAPAVPLYEVTAPEFLGGLNKLLTQEDLAVWKVYLRFHVMRTSFLRRARRAH
jgi:putative endopeptidase